MRDFNYCPYDYNNLKNPNKTLPKATIWAVISVIVIYLKVMLGSPMIVGAQSLVENKEIALSIAGKKALGSKGLIIVTIPAAFSTGTAINATLFSTARLMESVAKVKRKWLCTAGAVSCALAIIADITVQMQNIPYTIV